MNLTFKRSLLAAAITLAMVPTAQATNGYFAHGYGTKNKAMAGAGVALPQDAMAAATNPAGMVWVGDRMDVGVEVFSPRREYTVDGAGSGGFALAPGTYKSDSNYFLVPSFARNWMLSGDSSFGISVYGNGGMNTDYPAPGPFGGGGTGVDLSQLFIAPTYSKKLSGNSSFGISPILAVQAFSARGLSPFSGYSVDNANLTNRGYDWSYGAGVRIGWQGEVSPGLTLGASATTKIYMSKFKKYKGLFADGGDFDIPAQITLGLAYKTSPTSVLAVDVQDIMYSGVNAIANPMLPNLTSAGLGSTGGAGFGWKDMTVVKVGYQWQSSPDWTWRVGVSHGKQPIRGSEVMFNILAPGVMETHFTGGFTKKMGKTGEFSMAAMYAPAKTVTGPNPLTAPGTQDITLKMRQFSVEASWGWRF